MSTHGLSQTPEYRVWQQMLRRCHEPDHPAFENYGGRGIFVCDRWRHSVEHFIADIGARPGDGYEIDRIDNDRGYEPGNIRWATRKENCRNRRSNRLVTIDDETRSVAEWAELTGKSPSTIIKRLDAGWPDREAVSDPVRGKAAAGHAKPQTKPCDQCGVQGVYGALCRSCENKRRWKEGTYQ